METETIIPLFEPNQILSSTHLNQLREYLDNETRYSRIKLSGVGIVCGLHLQSVSASAIVVTTGYGITTDGLLLDLPDKQKNGIIRYTRYQPYIDPSLPAYNFGKSMGTDSRWHESYAGHQEPLPKKKGSKGGNDSTKPVEEIVVVPEIFELFTDEKTDYDKDAKLLSQFDADGKIPTNLADMSIVYLCEFDDEDLKSCTGSNCDNKGKRRDVTLRMLLVPTSRLSAYATKDFLFKQNPLPCLEIPRLKNAELKLINSLATLKSTYNNTIIDAQAAKLRTALQTAVTSCSYLLALTGMNVTDAVKRLTKGESTYIGNDNSYVQYTADVLHDATQSYNEFVEAMWLFFRACGTLPFNFPRHLTLGQFQPGKNKAVDEWRTVFFNSPPKDGQDIHLENARTLFNKTLKLLLSFQDVSRREIDKNNIRLIPDLTQQQPFSERSVPYYYASGEAGDNAQLKELLRLWNTEKTIRGKEAERYGYFAEKYAAPEPFSKPFDYSFFQSPMLRIEGIAGMTVSDAKSKLEELREKYNLDFDIRLLRLDNSATYYEADSHCELNDLQADYLLVREEIICCVKSLYNFLVEADTHGLHGKFQLKSYGGKIGKENALKPFLLALDTAEKLISDFFTGKKELFEKVCKALPIDLREFDYGKFLRLFKLLQHFSAGYRLLLEQTGLSIKDLLRNMEVTFYDWFEQSELWRIIDRLRTLNCQCTYPKLGIIESIRDKRLKNKKDAGYFPNFIKTHNGAEHYAGVPVGGTFCLVYSSSKIFANGPEQQVVADFALHGSCCGNSCYGDELEIRQPIVAVYDEVNIDGDDKETDLEKGLEIDVLRNDYYIDRPAVGISEATIVEEEVPDSKNSGKISVIKKNGRSVIVYKTTSKAAVTDAFLLRITDEKTNAFDYSTLIVNVSKRQLFLINTKPDRAATLAGKKVDINVRVNDNNQTALTEFEIILIDKEGKEYKPGEPCPTAKGNIAVATDKKVNPTVVFDSANTKPEKLKEVVTDTFQYVIRDKAGNFSLPVSVEVDIIPCCDAKVKFSMAKTVFCKNDAPEAIIIDVPGSDPATLDVTGAGASKVNGQWKFNPASTEVTNTRVDLTLIYKDTKQVLAILPVRIHPIANFEVNISRINQDGTLFITGSCSVLEGNPDYSVWSVNGVPIYTGRALMLTLKSFPPTVEKLNVKLKAYHENPSVNPNCYHEQNKDFPVTRLGTNAGESIPELTLNRYMEKAEFLHDEKFIAAANANDAELYANTVELSAKTSELLLNRAELSKLSVSSREKLINETSVNLDKLNIASENVTDPDPSAKAAIDAVYKENALEALNLVVASAGTTKPTETTAAAVNNIGTHLIELSKAGSLTATDLKVVDDAILAAKNNAVLNKTLTAIRNKF